MADDVFQIKVNLRRSTGTELAVASRSADGTIIRSNGLFNDRQAVRALVESHFEAVKKYDPQMHERVHQLAVEAARSQMGTQEGKRS